MLFIPNAPDNGSGDEKTMPPMIIKKNAALPLPSPDDRRAHDQRLQDTLGLGPLVIPLSILKRLPGLVKEKPTFPCIVCCIGNAHRLIDIDTERSYSIALDLGTTNLVALLYDNIAQKDVLARTLENPQIAYGSDILTRMHSAMTDRVDDVYGSLLAGINSLITTLCASTGIEPNDIHALSVAGNTVMTHFFLGLDISSIPIDPFVPVVGMPGSFIASELQLAVNPEAVVYVFPNAGSYVGGDITAGILSSGMFLADKTSVLIDVGTNAEVVIGNREWMLVGAGAAGPALEEGISRIGKRAKKGIVYDVEIRGPIITCKTFDQGTPEGICGSGMVSLLYELYKAGRIDQSGMLVESGHLTLVDGEKAFDLACGSPVALAITQREILNFMKSKAAMFTLLLVLTRFVGLSFKDIDTVYVAGALGTGIDAAKAVGIGMLPAWPAETVKPLGNSSLAGARMLLADGDLARTVKDIAGKITYKHMHDDPEFMKEYRGAVFIPHTNPEMLKVV
jgi:uncharacterized 2Fe-2S/4Fe-4S cluster protein (DUF4445 family)